MKTEEEVASLWCPFGRKIIGPTAGYNRDTEDEPVSFCLGSGCCLWESVFTTLPGNYGKCGMGANK
jgi:hypothetical protein